MPRPAFTWAIADTHWFHDAICTPEFENRPVDHMERTIRNCRKVIAPQDTLIHLGDVIFYQNGELAGLLGRIPCHKKILVRGNHDKKSSWWYMHNGFDWVCDAMELGGALLSHKPYQIHASVMNVHGHWHTMGPKPGWWSDDRHHLIALETNGYRPERLDQILSGVQT